MQDLFGNTLDANPILFPTDYNSILERLQHINPIKYAKSRNFINGSVTYLAPYISRGVVSLKQVKEIIMGKGLKPIEIEKLLQELAWREYYQRVWQEKGNLIWQDLKQGQPDTAHHGMLSALQEANTGIKVIDDQISKLYSAGYLHNHIRMYLAAITCNNAKAHWMQPAKWMYYHLLDGDIASNNCSWQWVAGAFSSKKYYCNQENINRYTNTNQANTFLDKSYEELATMPIPAALKVRVHLELQTNLPATKKLNLDTTKPTLIYNSYNLDPKWREHEDVNRVLLLEPSHFNSYPVSEKVIEFVISLSRNIQGIQVYCGEIADLKALYQGSQLSSKEAFISKEHPAFNDYPGIKDSREWMFPEVTGYYPSFFSYWKKCEKSL